jgi:hypothetical protein
VPLAGRRSGRARVGTVAGMTTTVAPLPRTSLLALHVTGILLAGAGITMLFVTNSVDAPSIWVGPIVFLATAVLILLRPRRWTLGVGIGFSLFVLTGAMIAPGLVDRLSDPTNTDAFIGTATQIIGLLLALGSGVIALVRTRGV